jgi:CRISPR system Cascade subunit CasD
VRRQVAPRAGAWIETTGARRDELVPGKSWLGTILSSREYRLDALVMIAVRALPDAPYDLQIIKAHLEKPRFHIYLGRKSYPLAAPMNPQIVKDKKNYYEVFKLMVTHF